MAAAVRLVVSVLTIFCLILPLTLSQRYGSAGKYLHVKKRDIEEYIGKGARVMSQQFGDDHLHRTRRDLSPAARVGNANTDITKVVSLIIMLTCNIFTCQSDVILDRKPFNI